MWILEHGLPRKMVKRFMQKTMGKEPLDSGLVQDLRQLRVTN